MLQKNARDFNLAPLLLSGDLEYLAQPGNFASDIDLILHVFDLYV